MTTTHTLQLHSTVHEDSTVTLALVEADLPVPGPDDVVVRMEAAPINPSDLGVMFANADMSSIVRDSSVAVHAVWSSASAMTRLCCAHRPTRIGWSQPTDSSRMFTSAGRHRAHAASDVGRWSRTCRISPPSELDRAVSRWRFRLQRA